MENISKNTVKKLCEFTLRSGTKQHLLMVSINNVTTRQCSKKGKPFGCIFRSNSPKCRKCREFLQIELAFSVSSFTFCFCASYWCLYLVVQKAGGHGAEHNQCILLSRPVHSLFGHHLQSLVVGFIVSIGAFLGL